MISIVIDSTSKTAGPEVAFVSFEFKISEVKSAVSKVNEKLCRLSLRNV